MSRLDVAIQYAENIGITLNWVKSDTKGTEQLGNLRAAARNTEELLGWIQDFIADSDIGEILGSKTALSTDSLEEAYKSGWDRGYEAYGPAGRGEAAEGAPEGLSAEDTEEWWLGYNAGMYDAEQEDMNIDRYGVGSAMIEGGESI